MVKPPPNPLDAVFRALADPTRRAIVARLAEGEASVGELATPFEISPPAITKHLGVLEEAGLVSRRREGRMRRCSLNSEPLEDALSWMVRYSRFWESQLDSLAHLLAGGDREELPR